MIHNSSQNHTDFTRLKHYSCFLVICWLLVRETCGGDILNDGLTSNEISITTSNSLNINANLPLFFLACAGLVFSLGFLRGGGCIWRCFKRETIFENFLPHDRQGNHELLQLSWTCVCKLLAKRVPNFLSHWLHLNVSLGVFLRFFIFLSEVYHPICLWNTLFDVIWAKMMGYIPLVSKYGCLFRFRAIHSFPIINQALSFYNCKESNLDVSQILFLDYLAWNKTWW